MTKKNWFFRIFFYILSLLCLALGIILNTKTELGVSPIISVAYSTSEVLHLNFGNVTFALYAIFVVVELIIRGKNRRYTDLLQLPLSLVFTRVMNFYNDYIPIHLHSFPAKFLLLLLAIVLTGIGAAMSVNMKLVPNPGDGIVNAIAEVTGKTMGITKNMFDALNISITFMIGLVSGHFLLGIGVGTVVAVLGVGRVVAVFNYLCKKPMAKLAGLDTEEEGTEEEMEADYILSEQTED
ncbi:MAG: DUF6198 family protein [Lachnospiraceae bacterium]|nr:DUF6198 family protein [Lachnospiraceae bacterium]